MVRDELAQGTTTSPTWTAGRRDPKQLDEDGLPTTRSFSTGAIMVTAFRAPSDPSTIQACGFRS